MRGAILVGAAVIGLTTAIARADGLDEPIPSFYQEPGAASNRDPLVQHPNERVDPFTGKLQWHYVDLFVPGNGGLDIKVQRSYSSVNEILPDDSAFGVGWTIHYGRLLRRSTVSPCATGLSATSNAVMELPDGSRQIMYDAPDGSGTTISTGRWKGTCANTTSGGVIVKSPDGTTYEMTTQGAPIIGSDPNHPLSTWYTTRIVDRNGNSLSFTYQFLNATTFAISTITASDGRTVTFSYAGGALSSVTSGNSTWSYGMTKVAGTSANQYNLDSVTRPDGTMWLYQYNSPGSAPGAGTPGGYSMKSATYPTGGRIDYTYQFVHFSPNTSLPVSTAVATKTAGTNIWNYTFTPATVQLVFSGGRTSYTIDPNAASTPQFDRFTVDGPEGSTTYLHIGYESVPSGAVYLIGTLAGKWIITKLNGQTAISQVESESHTLSLISNQANVRPGSALSFDDATYSVVVTQRQLSRNGRVYQIDYSNFDQYDNPQTIVETGSDHRTTTVTYYTDPTMWILHQKKDETTDTIGTISRSFFPTGNLQSESRYGVTTAFTYDAEGNIQTKTDANGNSTTYQSYRRGIPQQEMQPEGVTVMRVVDDNGNITSQTDGENVATGYGYDGLNRLRTITHPLGNNVTVTWAANSRTVTRGRYTEVVTFDGFGRQVQVKHTDTTTNAVITQDYRVDVLGRRVFASYPNDTIGTGFFYDLVGQTLGVYHGYNPDANTFSSTRVFTYSSDLASDKVAMTNERNATYNYTYRSYADPDHRDLMTITTPQPDASITMERNGLGQLTKVTQDGKSRSYAYDEHFFLHQMTDPETGNTVYGRDAIGNMTSRQVGTMPVTTFGYDGRNRLYSVTYPAGTPSVTKTYYKDDKPKSSDNGIARHDYSYDSNKNLKQETLTVRGQPAFTIAYGYDQNDALDTITYGSGRVVTYSPDGFGRPTRASPYVTKVFHHPNGQVASLTYANGVQATIGLNARKWPQTLQLTGNTPILNTSYTYDELGNVFGIDDTLDPSYFRSMNYDLIDRLTQANGSWGNGTISYNGHGDITSQALGTSSLTYAYDGATNKLSAVTGTRNFTYQYDGYGNVTANGANTFAYNDASNMTCTGCGTGLQTTYDYDAGNMRVRSTTSGVSTYFIYSSNGSLLWETSPGSSLTEYIYLHGKQVATRRKTGS
jgi:YD repeat-containing protein